MKNKLHISIFFLSLFIILVSFVVMLGWFLDIELFKSLFPGFVTMKFSTALTFFLSGLLLFIMNYANPSALGFPQIALPVLSLLIFLFMATLLVSVFLGFQSGVELIIREETDAVASTAPGRPSLGTMFSFLIIAFSGTVDAFLTARVASRFHAISGRALLILGGIALVGYSISLPMLYYFIEGFSTAMAIHTAILFIVSGITLQFISYKRKKQ